MNKRYIKPSITVKTISSEQILAANSLVIKDKTYEETQGVVLNAKTNNFSVWDEDENEDE